MHRKAEVALPVEVSGRSSRLRTAGRRLRAVLGSPWLPALLILLGYGWWLLGAFRAGHEARDFIFIGPQFVRQSHTSAVIKLDPRYHYLPGTTGYDGQFAYFIALDPIHARDYLDSHSSGSAGPDYRYTRILYPMLARALALGRADAIPAALLLINWISIAAGTLAVAAWLRRRRLSPWLALLYGLYPGIFVALQRDLNEALAYALVALAVYLYDRGTRRMVVGAALTFALASLARETTLVFPLAYVIGSWTNPISRVAGVKPEPTPGRTRAVFGVLCFLPFILWKLFLWYWLGSIGRSGGVYPQPIPLGGLFSYWPWGRDAVEQAVAVVAPALIALMLALWAVARRWWTPEVWALLLNILLFVVFLNGKSYVEYYASGRVTAGVVLAAIYCVPIFRAAARRARWWIWLCALLWLSLLPALVAFPRRAARPTDALVDLALVVALWVVSRITTPRADGPDQKQVRVA